MRRRRASLWRPSAKVRDSLILPPEPTGQAGHVIMQTGLCAVGCSRLFSALRGAWFEMSLNMVPGHQPAEWPQWYDALKKASR
ncbi:hypothetical protein RY45_04680 [Aeromonas hydrophila]|nr:hypothetical protein RY45_04680 [Aeromonas hydrophila]